MATKSANVTARVQPEIKRQAEAVLERIGLPVSVLIDTFKDRYGTFRRWSLCENSWGYLDMRYAMHTGFAEKISETAAQMWKVCCRSLFFSGRDVYLLMAIPFHFCGAAGCVERAFRIASLIEMFIYGNFNHAYFNHRRWIQCHSTLWGK